MSSVPPAGTTGLTYTDLLAWPEPSELGYRYELLGGELLVSPSPGLRHQAAVLNIAMVMGDWAKRHGGQTFIAPTDVYVTESTVLQPDVLVLGPEHVASLEDKAIRRPPDLVVEVSSPSTRNTDQVRKRRVYEREGVAEFWFVDLDTSEIHCYWLDDEGTYGQPEIVPADGTVMSRALPGLSIPAGEALGR